MAVWTQCNKTREVQIDYINVQVCGRILCGKMWDHSLLESFLKNEDCKVLTFRETRVRMDVIYWCVTCMCSNQLGRQLIFSIKCFIVCSDSSSGIIYCRLMENLKIWSLTIMHMLGSDIYTMHFALITFFFCECSLKVLCLITHECCWWRFL